MFTKQCFFIYVLPDEMYRKCECGQKVEYVFVLYAFKLSSFKHLSN